MKPLEMVVIERSIEGKRERDLPVCFRCGKRRLPVDSIRASSGYHVKGGGVRKGKNKKKRGEYQV